ncbi:Asp23/Gls24 family envelope stress response protein [Sciscionella marina]|uniref:Asp23/Gls24 family envelope stress response protein n=1 Tax=Sciscionella marina TaxID=508770 RepID=UPI00035D2AB0|nr:Asp23/Gls24 family envelope stress response protein [Sciscionella marina]
MAMTPGYEPYLLPCGRELEQVWQNLEAGRTDEHEASCRHCATARESLGALHAATAELLTDQERPSGALTDRIMSAVRAEVRRGDLLPLPPTELGPVEISEQAVAVVLRYAADEVTGVRARRCRVRVADESREGVVLVTAELTIAVAHATGVETAAEIVRERVRAACANRIGFELARLDVHIADVYDV